jgi:hypothetical protein
MGAAAKRTREEGEEATEDSLAKRPKPAVAAAAATTVLLMLVVRTRLVGSPLLYTVIVFSCRD